MTRRSRCRLAAASGTKAVTTPGAATERDMTAERNPERVEVGRELEGIDFGIKKSMRYHSSRRAVFERLDNFTNWLVAVAGASAFASVVGDEKGKLAIYSTFVVMGIALADVIFGFGARARLHQDLYRRFSELAVEIAKLDEPTARDVAELRAKRLAIEADEPHIIDALERWCWNEEAEARGSNQFQTLTKWQQIRARLSTLV